MKIIVRCGGRYKDDKKAEKFLNHHAGYLNNFLPILAEKFKLKLPSKIILRPLYSGEFAMMAGRLNYVPGQGYSIALHIEACMGMRGKGEEVVVHECAHLVNALKHKYWGHGKIFQEMHSICCKIGKEER